MLYTIFMKKISVIIPCYNVENHIDRCISSIESQTIGISDIELILVDDASDDNSYIKLKTWEEKYPDDIILIQHESNHGQSTARNTGLLHSSCDYIAFIDGDDWVDPLYLERMYKIAVTESCDLIQCGFIRETAASPVIADSSNTVAEKNCEIINIESEEIRKTILTNKKVSSNAPFKLIKKTLLTDNQIFFYDGLKYEDIAFGILLSMYSQKLCILPDKMYHYRVNESSTVLKKNESYHIDLISVWINLWSELNARGFYLTYKDEFELEFVYSCIMIFWKILALRFDNAPYSYYKLLCSLSKNFIPDIQNNTYINHGSLGELHMLLLSSVLKEVDNNDFHRILENIKKIGL